MEEEPPVRTEDEQPRLCPVCGARVAARATTCLICGAVLNEQEPAHEAETKRELPGWVQGLAAVGLALLILAAGGFGLYRLMQSNPQEAAPSVTPSHTPTSSPTATATRTPPPTLTPTSPPPRVHQVQPNETLSEIAENYNVPISDLLALNPDLDPELIQVGQVLLIPPDISLLASTEPTATPGDFIVHVVAAGETLDSISEKYGVSVDKIRLANGLPEGDQTIRVNQSLAIPVDTPTPTPTPIPDTDTTPTAIPLYPAPPLLNPLDGAILSPADGPLVLEWASVGILRKNEWYEVQLLEPGGGVISQTAYTRATSWRVPGTLLLEAKTEKSKFSWHVRVVRGSDTKYEQAGAPSRKRSFVWLAPTPSPEPTSAPVE